MESSTAPTASDLVPVPTTSALSVQQLRNDGIPFLVHGSCRDRLACAPIPIRRVGSVTFTAVEKGMYPGTVARLDVLCDLVRSGPVTLSIMPKRTQEPRQLLRLVERKLANFLGGHAVIIGPC